MVRVRCDLMKKISRGMVFKKQTGGPSALFRPPVCFSVEVLFQFRQLTPSQEAVGVAHLRSLRRNGERQRNHRQFMFRLGERYLFLAR
jgi:hypothetical protein